MRGSQNFLYGVLLLALGVLSGCGNLNHASQGSGVYYNPSQQPVNASQEEKRETSQNSNTGQNQQEAEVSRKSQPQVINPESEAAYERESDQENQGNSSNTFDYYPEEQATRSGTRDLYGPESDYSDFKYTNRIRRFESDLNFNYFDPFYYGPGFGHSPFYRDPFWYNDGLSIGVSFGNRPFYNRYDPFFYDGWGFRNRWDYRWRYQHGFYGSRYGFYDPYSGFAGTPYWGGYRHGYYPYGDFNNNSGSKEPTMNRPRNPLGSNYDTDKTPSRNAGQNKGRNIQRRQKQRPGSNKNEEVKDNRQYDYYNPRRERKHKREPNRRTPNSRQERSNPSRSRDLDPSRTPNVPSERRQPDRNFNQDDNRLSRPDRSNFDRKRRRSPNRNNRNPGGNNRDKKMNRPRR